MNSSTVAEIMKNIGDIGLTGKYNSGSLTPMGLNGPTANPFLGIQEPGADYLAPVIKGGRRRKTASARSTRRRRHRSRRSRR